MLGEWCCNKGVPVGEHRHTTRSQIIGETFNDPKKVLKCLNIFYTSQISVK